MRTDPGVYAFRRDRDLRGVYRPFETEREYGVHGRGDDTVFAELDDESRPTGGRDSSAGDLCVEIRPEMNASVGDR